jgi:glycosyltransferase involved in cell wall biosynthesis
LILTNLLESIIKVKNKVVIIGPIGDFGGREIESGFIAKSLSEIAEVRLLSTINCSSKSQIFDFIDRNQFIGLYNLLFKKYFSVRFFALLSYLKSGFKNQPHFYVNNSISKRIGLSDKSKETLLNLLKDYDLIVICAQLSSTYIKDIVGYSSKNNIPIFFRTSNTIKESDFQHKEWFWKISIFIHHSISNATRFNFIKGYNYSIIDQCCIYENELLKINPTQKINNLLFIGRLSEEKGIKELVIFCSKIKTITLDVIGDGILMKELEECVKDIDNVKLLGFKRQDEIIEYVNLSDAVIISSYEEAGPLTGLEAMASARIILSTKVGAMEERLKNLKNQFWFSINDYISFENLIFKIQKIDKIELIKIASENRNRYVKHFSKEIISQQYIDLAKQFLKQ